MRTFLKFSCLILTLAALIEAEAALSSAPLHYYPAGFYSSLDAGLRDGDLKNELFTILSAFHRPRPGQHDEVDPSCSGSTCYKHRSLGYNGARRLLFGQFHLSQSPDGYSIRDVYCDRLVTREDFTSNPPGPGQIPDARVMNTEHTWPQSRFSSRFNKELQKSDLHILFPVLSRANSSRGNDEFGDVVTVTSSPCPASSRGYTARGGRKVYFEVPDFHKGNVARALFYFSVRYDLRINADEEDSLRAWHRADPADSDELARNSAIFDKQKVRNPFIDHPELVELISDF